MALLEIDNLHVSYGRVEVLHGISLYVDEGEIVTLLGANGAGATAVRSSLRTTPTRRCPLGPKIPTPISPSRLCANIFQFPTVPI